MIKVCKCGSTKVSSVGKNMYYCSDCGYTFFSSFFGPKVNAVIVCLSIALAYVFGRVTAT